MVGAAYAAVPLYNWFCRTTGFAGTPQIATAEPSQAIGRKVTVRFDANIAGGLPWQFELQCLSTDRGRLFFQDQLFLLQRAAAQSRREASHERGILRRSQDRAG